MSRFRSVVVVACLAVVLATALPAPGSASRSSEQAAATAVAEPSWNGVVGAVVAWGEGAWAWLRAIVAEEHGNITPLSPPPPPPPPSDVDEKP
jgi:hypothetical protein